MEACSEVIVRYSVAAISYMVKADILFFQPEKLSKHFNIFGSTFYRHNCVIFFLDREKSNAKHRCAKFISILENIRIPQQA